MRVVNLEQNSPEWVKWRDGGIGSSEAPTILMENPYESPFALWRRKTGRAGSKTETAAMKHGKDTEAAARDAYCAETGEFMPPACGIHDEHDWMLASMDGMSSDGTLIVEIKCPTELANHLSAREGQVPDHYFSQVQHQLAVSGAEMCHFWSFFGGKGALVEVRPAGQVIKEMIEAEREFWRWVMEDKFPMPQGEVDLTDDAEAILWAQDWADTKKMQRQIERKLRELETQMRQFWLKNHRKLICGPVEVSQMHRKGYSEEEPRTVGESISCTFKLRDYDGIPAK